MQTQHHLSPRRPGIQPYDLLSLPLEFGRMMETFISGTGTLLPFNSPMGLLSPVRIDVLEDESALQLVAEMPGVEIQDIDVELEGQQLTISGHKNGESHQHIDRFHIKERSFGHFSRTVLLPFPTDAQQVSADFCNGVLTLRVPKPEAFKQAQHIRIRDRGREVGVPTTHLEPSPNGLRPGIGAPEDGQHPVEETSEGEGPDVNSPGR